MHMLSLTESDVQKFLLKRVSSEVTDVSPIEQQGEWGSSLLIQRWGF